MGPDDVARAEPLGMTLMDLLAMVLGFALVFALMMGRR